MKVLSLFDGISCGMVALERAGITVDRYVAYEIDKYAIQVSTANYPQIEHCGDVTTADFTQYKGFDLLIGGSPCTYWSIAKKDRETTSDGIGFQLFSQYVRALKESGCKWFFYENNYSIHKDIKTEISKALGVEPIMINSALLSAQQRKRCYWTNIPGIQQPEDKGILLKDILESGQAWQDKPYCMTSSYQFGVSPQDTISKSRRSMVAESVGKPQKMLNVNPSGNGMNENVYSIDGKSPCATTNKGEGQKIIEPICVAQRGRYIESDNRSVKCEGGTYQAIEPRTDGKTNCLTTVQKDNLVCEPICVNSQSGRKDGLAKQPSVSDRIYSVDGKNPLVTSGFKNYIAEPLIVKEATKKGYVEIEPGSCVDLTQPNSKTRRGREMKDKCNCIMTSCQYYQYCGTLINPIYKVKNGYITMPNGKAYKIDLVDGCYIIRKLTPVEAERLQTLPDNYTTGISNSQRYKCIGNGWTVDVIAHILSYLKAVTL